MDDLASQSHNSPNQTCEAIEQRFEEVRRLTGWGDEELYDAFCYAILAQGNLQVCNALSYRDITEGEYDLRKVYNLHQQMSQHIQETGENLIKKAFEHVSDE